MEGKFDNKREALTEALYSKKAVQIQWYYPEKDEPYFTQIGIVDSVHKTKNMFNFKVYDGIKLMKIEPIISIGYIGTSSWLYRE